MAESTSDNTVQTQVIDAATSGIPSEMLPLLAEMAKADSDGQFITLALPMEEQQASGSRDNLEDAGEQQKDQPSTSRRAGKSRKGDNYIKSRVKRKKMELYVREHRKFVHVGDEIERWDQYRKELRVKSDKEFAKLLLDGFRKYTKVVQLVAGPTFGFPEIGSQDQSSLQPKVAPKEEHDDYDLADYIEEVQQGLAEAEVEVRTDPQPGGHQKNQQNGGVETPKTPVKGDRTAESEQKSSEGPESPGGDQPSSPPGDDQPSSPSDGE